MLGAYYVLRLIASNCTGSGCEVYIPLSVLLPLLIWVTAIAAGVIAARNAWSRHRRVWSLGLAALTLLAIVVPPASLYLLRDNPDALVPTVTVVLALVPVAAFVSGWSQ